MNLKITIRVNTDKTNIHRVDEILDFIEKYELKNRIGLYLAPIDNVNGTCNATQCFNNQEFAVEQLQFIKRNLERGFNFVNIPSPNVYICGAPSSNSCVIDAEGDIYKCWDDVSRKEYKCGTISEGITMNSNTAKWLSYDFMDEECGVCAYLPVCMGGCPNYRIRYGKKKCIPFKENAIEIVELLYDLYNKEGR